MTAGDRARTERAAQGLPEHVEDPVTLAKIATLIVYGIASEREVADA